MSECKHKWIFQETKTNTSRIKGDYAHILNDGKIEKVSLDRIYDVKE